MNIAALSSRSAGVIISSLIAVAALPYPAGAQNTASQASTISSNGQTIMRMNGGSGGAQLFSTSSDDNRPEWMTAAKLNLVISGGNIVDDGKSLAPATVANVLEYIGKKEPSFSYILTPGAGNVEVADMVLHNVRVVDFPRALLTATDSPLNASFDRNPTNPILQVSGPSTRRVVEAFNLSSYLGKPAASDSFGPAHPAVQAAREKLESLKELILKTIHDVDDKQDTLSKSLSFEFHDGSGVLVVIGQERALAVARQVIGALQPRGAIASSFDSASNAIRQLDLRPVQDAVRTRLEVAAKLLGDASANDGDLARMQMEIDRLMRTMNDYQQNNPLNGPDPLPTQRAPERRSTGGFSSSSNPYSNSSSTDPSSDNGG